eukprot:1278411-Pleurochrysis_carterae.AAC.3
MHLTRNEQQQLIQRIPNGHHLIIQACKAFWELKLTLSEQYVRTRGTPDLVRAIPLAHNNFFKFTKLTLQTLQTAGITRIDQLYDENNKFHNWNLYWNILNQSTSLTPSQMKSTIKTIRNAQNRIPKWLLTVLSQKRTWKTPFMCGWSDMEGKHI